MYKKGTGELTAVCWWELKFRNEIERSQLDAIFINHCLTNKKVLNYEQIQY
jgi:hypothetical protein